MSWSAACHALFSVTVLMPCQDIQIAVGCWVIRRPTLQDHDPKMKIKKPQHQVSLHLKTPLDITVNIVSQDLFDQWSFLFPWTPLVQKLLKARPTSKLAQCLVQARSPRISHSLSSLLLQCSTTLTMFFPLLSSWNFPCCNVCLLPLILSVGASEKGPSLSYCLGFCFPGALQS